MPASPDLTVAPMILPILADAAAALNWADLGLDPVIAQIGPFSFRWYSLAYVAGILIGWWYLGRLMQRPNAPMTDRQVDDFIILVTIGIIGGGRLGYCLFYRPESFLNPLSVLRIWEGGMSFHGGVVGVGLAIWFFVSRQKLNGLRVLDHVAVVYPIGHLFGRLANFVNGELWGRPSDLPWAMTFPAAGDTLARHPSQLYQAALEGVMLAAIMAWVFYRTNARLEPGRLAGVFGIVMGLVRFGLEFFRQPDAGVNGLLGLSMGQLLSVPLIIGGLWLYQTAPRRALTSQAA